MKKAAFLSVAAGVLFVLAFAVPRAQAQTMCTMQYAPVCGSKPVQCITAPCYPVYQTYGNSCMAGADGATIIHQGECTASETGPVIPKPQPPIYTPPPVYYPPVYYPPVYTPPVYYPPVYYPPVQTWYWWQPWSWSWRW